MIPLELGSVLVEAVRDENGDIVKPGVSGRGTEEYPAVSLGDSEEKLTPLSRTNQSLLIEDEKRAFNISKSSDVIPAIDTKPASCRT
jgi:hypothetical protein